MFKVDTDPQNGADLEFTYGTATDDVYFADFDGDGKDGICVLRGALLDCVTTVTEASDPTAHWTYAYGNGLYAALHCSFVFWTPHMICLKKQVM